MKQIPQLLANLIYGHHLDIHNQERINHKWKLILSNNPHYQIIINNKPKETTGHQNWISQWEYFTSNGFTVEHFSLMHANQWVVPTNPDISFFIEIFENGSFSHWEEFQEFIHRIESRIPLGEYAYKDYFSPYAALYSNKDNWATNKDIIEQIFNIEHNI